MQKALCILFLIIVLPADTKPVFGFENDTVSGFEVAKIELSQNNTSAAKTDVGFVPLLHVRGWYAFTAPSRLVLDIDALAGGPGRAEDASLKLCTDVGEHWSVSAGYRTVEGGADVDEVYNFAWFQYAVASLSYRF